MTIDLDALQAKVVDLLMDPVCVVDAEGSFVFVSAACERLLGYTPDELIGANMIDLVHPDDRERTLAAAERIMRDEPQMNFENRYVGKDGRIVHIMWSARWSEADGVRVAVARDVTALKNAERMQQALYRISEAAHAADDLPALCHDIHGIIDGLLPARNFCVALYDPSANRLAYPCFVDERLPARATEEVVAGTPIAEVLHSGEPVLTTRDMPGTDAAGGMDEADWLGVPLVAAEGVVGALVVHSYSPRVRYGHADRDLLQFVSVQVATAIERKRAETRWRYMAQHDPLTDVPNRTLFNDRCDVALERAKRDGEHAALLYLDLDGFKKINDVRGHEVGDELLREVACRLARCVRESDTVGRIGGDEFAVLLTNLRQAGDADAVVEKIRRAIAVPFDLQGERLTISASIGVAVYPDDGEDRAALLRAADAAMYSGKQGR